MNGAGIRKLGGLRDSNGHEPVKAGAYIQLYATGEGLTSPPGSDGALAATTLPLPTPVLPVSVTAGGLPASVTYAGATPGTKGEDRYFVLNRKWQFERLSSA